MLLTNLGLPFAAPAGRGCWCWRRIARQISASAGGPPCVAFALGSAAHALSIRSDVTTRIPLRYAPLIAVSTGNIVVFWLFTRALFDEEFRLSWWHGLVWALGSPSASQAASGLHPAAMCGFP